MNDAQANATTELPSSGHATMRPRARLISLIGDELISDEPVAVVELVKNAYDADATKVRVEFRGKNPLDPDTLIIQDNGHGMDLPAVLSGWFEPGTIHKKIGELSPKKRPYQGAKGIGRFAAARLADSLYMETKQEGSVDGVTVLLDWGRFSDDCYLDEVTIDYEVNPLSSIKQGTLLSLSNLHSRRHWSESDFEALHVRLSRLISPFYGDTGLLEVSDFEIELVLPGYPNLTGKVEPHEITKKPKYKLSGNLSKDGLLTGQIEIDGKISKRLKCVPIGNKGDAVKCGPLAVEIRTWDRDRAGLAPYMLKYDMAANAIRAVLNNYSGVSIYRDGFRVHPYGQKGLDWLSLDTRSRQNPTLRLANNQIIASLSISRIGNQGLTDRTTREGLVHNAEYDSLKDYFVKILSHLEEERYRVRPRAEDKPEDLSTLFEPFDMTDMVKEVNEQLGTKHPVTSLVKKKEVEVRSGVKRLQEHYSRVLTAAGLGQLIDRVVHEIGAPLGRANGEVNLLEKDLSKMLGPHRSKQLAERFTNIRAFLDQIHNRREWLLPRVSGKRGRKSSFVVQEEIQGNLELYSSLIAKQGIDIKLSWPKEPIVVHMSRSDLGQIVANLLDNSIYWLTRHHGDGKGGKIQIRLTNLKHGFRLLFSDDGPGVAIEDLVNIFDPEFSRKPHGMGLGLFIARQVIEKYGKLLYRDDGPMEGACFEATFEQHVGI